MAQTTAIEWTDLTWNPTFGCSRVSTGCRECYAETTALRFGHSALPWTERNAAQNVILKPHKLREPLSGAKAWQGLGPAAAAAGKTDGKLVFVNSMSDLFHERIPDEYIARVFTVRRRAERHTFQVLTKRPDRMRDFTARLAWRSPTATERSDTSREPWERSGPQAYLGAAGSKPLPNVWLGVSIENRKWVGRADVLRQVPAAVRFISAEPLLGPLVHDAEDYAHGRGGVWSDCSSEPWSGDGYDGPELDLRAIDWVIVGGESGPNHRPMNLEWARGLRDSCAASLRTCAHCIGDCYTLGTPGSGPLQPCTHCAGLGQTRTAFFFKQWGGARPTSGGRLLDGRTWDEMPVRELRLQAPG